MDMTAILPILRVRIGLPADDTSKDAELETVYAASVAMAETYCDRKFYYEAAYEETLTYEADKTLSLERYPLEAINTISGVDITPMDYDPIRFDRKSGIVYAYGFADNAELVINYAGGYQVLPPDLFQAMLLIFDVLWSTNKSGGGAPVTPSGDIKAISVPDVGRVEFDTGSSSGGSGSVEAWGLVPASATSILHFYRREFV